MKNYKGICLSVALLFLIDSYGMKRDRDVYEQKEHEHQAQVGPEPKKAKVDDDYVNDEIEFQPIDQGTGELIAFCDIKERISEITQYAHRFKYPNLYIRDLIDSEIKQIETSNLIVYLHALPLELIEYILLLCMKLFFEDAVELSSELSTRYIVHFIICTNKLEDPCNMLNIWQENCPYPKMFEFLDTFPLKNVCRKLMESKPFKHKLSHYMRNILIKLFKTNDVIAGKFLRDITSSVFFDISSYILASENKRQKLDIMLFAHCLAEADIHPNQECYSAGTDKRTPLFRFNSLQPFCLLEFALCISDYPFTAFLIKEKGGDISKVSQQLNYLTSACKIDSVQMVKLNEKYNINWYREPITGALFEAIKNKSYKVLAFFIKYLIELNDVELLQTLVDVGLEINQLYGQEESAFTKETPLMLAVMYGNFEILKKLIEEWGADINLKNNQGETALFYCCHSFASKPLNKNLAYEIAEYLVSKGALVNVKDDQESTLIHAAIQNVKLLQLFKGLGLDVNVVDKFGNIPLIEAVLDNNIKSLRFLVESGADINVRDNFRNIPVIFCCFVEEGSCSFGSDEKEIARYLIEKGANAFEVLNDGDYDGFNLLHFTIVHMKNLDAVKFLVEELGFDVNQPNKAGNTPLELARGCEEIQKYLEEKMNS